jgi:hypothetical protein
MRALLNAKVIDVSFPFEIFNEISSPIHIMVIGKVSDV